MEQRPSWDEYFLKLAMLASERATCPRMHCGCVLVRDKMLLPLGTMDQFLAMITVRTWAAGLSIIIAFEQTMRR